MILLIILGCSQKESNTSNPIEGAWQVVSWQNITGDSLVWELGVDFIGTEMKIWSKNHFAFSG